MSLNRLWYTWWNWQILLSSGRHHSALEMHSGPLNSNVVWNFGRIRDIRRLVILWRSSGTFGYVLLKTGQDYFQVRRHTFMDYCMKGAICWQRSFTLPSSFLGGPCQVLTPHNFGMNPDPPCQWEIHPAKVKTVVKPLYYLLKTYQCYKYKHMGAILDRNTSCKITVSCNIQ